MCDEIHYSGIDAHLEKQRRSVSIVHRVDDDIDDGANSFARVCTASCGEVDLFPEHHQEPSDGRGVSVRVSHCFKLRSS